MAGSGSQPERRPHELPHDLGIPDLPYGDLMSPVYDTSKRTSFYVCPKCGGKFTVDVEGNIDVAATCGVCHELMVPDPEQDIAEIKRRYS